MDVSGDAAPRRAHRRRHGALAGPRRGAADLRLRPLHRLQGRRLEPGAGDAAAARAARRASTSTGSTRPARNSSISWSNAPSSPLPTARSFTAIPISSRCRSTTLLSDAYNDERRKLIGDKASLELRPGSVEGFGAVVKLRREEGQRAAVGAHGRGRADRRPHRRGARRHRAFRHRRPGRQHGVGDAVRRLAAILAGHSRARLLPRHARADVLAGGGPSRRRSRPASGRARRCRRRWRCATAKPYLAWGSPGGDQQDQWTTQFFLRHVHAGMNLQEAIDAPAWHSEHFPISFWPRTARPGRAGGRGPRAEGDASTELRRRGHNVEVDADWSRRPAHRRVARRPAPPRRRQSARHAGLCRGAVSRV